MKQTYISIYSTKNQNPPRVFQTRISPFIKGGINGGFIGKKLLFTLFCVFLLCSISAGYDFHQNAGKTSANFLKIGQGARYTGMGESFVGLSDDVYAVLVNPAGYENLKYKELSFSYVEWFGDVRDGFIGYGQKLDKYIAMGLGIMTLYSGMMEKRILPGDAPSNFWAIDSALILGFSYQILPYLSVGINAKGIFEMIDLKYAYSVAFDFGVLQNTPVKGLSVGASLLNVGTKLRYINNAFILPITGKIGFAYRTFNDNLILTSELEIPVDNYPEIKIGAEYLLLNIMAFRLGYNYRFYTPSSEILSNFSGGMGFFYNNMKFDYSYTLHPDFSVISPLYGHRATLTFLL